MNFKFTRGVAIGVDLGTANTLICFNDKILINEPSIVAVDAATNELLAFGSVAKMMHEKTNRAIKTIKPLRDGVIADFSGAELLIKVLVNQINVKSINPFFPSLTMLFSVPTGITEVEKRAVKDSGINAGASEVIMIFEPIASAIGAGLDVSSPEGILIVDIGGGITQVALIALSGIVIEQSIKTAGNTFDNDIINFFKKEYSLLIGERTAEEVKINMSTISLKGNNENGGLNVIGRDLLSGIPKSVKIHFDDFIIAIEKSILRIEETILKVLENSPPELASDIHLNGIYVSGGGALVMCLEERLKIKLGLKVKVVDDPLISVIKGISMVLKDRKKYSSIIFKTLSRKVCK